VLLRFCTSMGLGRNEEEQTNHDLEEVATSMDQTRYPYSIRSRKPVTRGGRARASTTRSTAAKGGGAAACLVDGHLHHEQNSSGLRGGGGSAAGGRWSFSRRSVLERSRQPKRDMRERIQ
jgi:hypothetical protein